MERGESVERGERQREEPLSPGFENTAVGTLPSMHTPRSATSTGQKARTTCVCMGHERGA